jgi:hypothetical protein
MKNSFVRKVVVERRVLSMVNSLTPGPRQLSGLSAAAIEAWRRDAHLDGADEVARRLARLGGLCQRLSDRSHESFQSVESSTVDQIDAELSQLSIELDAFKR